MKNKVNKNGFIAISMIYSVFVLFVTILIAIMFSYINDRKTSNTIKQDIKDRFAAKLPEVIYTNIDNVSSNAFDVQVNIKRGSFPVGTSKYIFSKNQNAIPNKVVGNGGIVSLSYDEEPGDYYLITKACDVFDNCTVTISTKYVVEESATFIPGSQFNSKLVSIANETVGGTANIISFRRSSEISSDKEIEANLVSTTNSVHPIYAYCNVITGSGVNCFYYTEAMRVRFNSDATGMFQNMSSLITVDLSDFDKTILTGASNMFTGCTALENVRTPLAYNDAPSIPLPDIFYSDESIPYNQILGSTKSRIWLTKGLVNYTIEYNLDGGELLEDNPVTYNRNSKTIILNNPVKEGYVFAGWSGGKNIVSYTNTGNYDGVTLDGDKIIFEKNDVPGNVASGIYMFAMKNSDTSTIQNIFQIQSPQCSGYQESTFTRDGRNTNRILLKINTNLSDAVLELSNMYYLDTRPYTVSFNVDEYNKNRALAKISNLQIELGSRATPFENHAEKEMKVIIPHGSQGSRHYFANWIPISENKYTLDINPNGGEWQGHSERVSKTLQYSEVFDIPNPVRDGYVFAGWKELNNELNTSSGIDTAVLYNNNGNGVVSVQLTPKSQDNPISTTTRQLTVTNNGTAKSSPGLGGFINYVTPQNNHTYVHVFVAKLPVGYYFHNAYNSFGTGGSTEWLTSQAGTGEYQTYAYRETTGTGSLGTFGHVYMSKSLTNTWNVRLEEKDAVTAYIAFSNIYDVTTNRDGIGQFDGSAKLTAKWETPKTLTIKPYPGTYKGDSSDYITTGKNGDTIDLFSNASREGYINYGWDLTGEGVINYFDRYNKSTPSTNNFLDWTNSSTPLPSAYRSSTVERETDGTGTHLKITTDVSSTFGGFVSHLYPLNPGRIHVVAIEAKLPVGSFLSVEGVGNMYTGVGSAKRNLDGSGTGEYKTYYTLVYAGKAGHFKDDTYIAVNSSSMSSVVWYVKSIRVLSFIPDNLKSEYTFGNGNATLTPKWSNTGSKVVFDPNGGTFNTTYVYNWGYGWFIEGSERMRFYTYNTSYANHPGANEYNWTPDVRVLTKSGYRLIGWYTAASGGTKVFNGDGTLVPNVSGISDSQGRWISTSNLTLYAQYAKRYYVNLETDSRSGAVINASSAWTHVTNGFGMDTVGRNYIVGERFGDLPVPTASGCTFTGWYTVGDVDGGTGFVIPASTSQWNYKAIKYSIVPGATYRITMDKAEVTSGSASQFQVRVFDFDTGTNGTSLLEKNINFGNNIDFELVIPGSTDMTHRVAILLYSGIGGSTKDIATKFTRIKIGTLSEGNGNKRTISSNDTFNDNRNIQFIAGWTCP